MIASAKEANCICPNLFDLYFCIVVPREIRFGFGLEYTMILMGTAGRSNADFQPEFRSSGSIVMLARFPDLGLD